MFAGCDSQTEETADAESLGDGVCDDSMEVGRCQVVGGGNCFGLNDEVTEFVPLEEDDLVPVVTGTQGLQMFVMAMRTSGIAPGNPEVPSDNDPIVEINVNRTSYSVVARFRGRVPFDIDSEERYFTSNLFVVIDRVTDVDDEQTLTATGRLRDANGEERCGSVDFKVAL